MNTNMMSSVSFSVTYHETTTGSNGHVINFGSLFFSEEGVELLRKRRTAIK